MSNSTKTFQVSKTKTVTIPTSLITDFETYHQLNTKIHHLYKCKFKYNQIKSILGISYQHVNNTLENPTKHPRENININLVNKYLNSIK